ncbi:MAG: hypothetical protein KME08_18505 [Aphanothece sp. CMT-3BRIN-NPC111]|nr:hypothetical protein [Aphanothece sp. CMT-3BRIN-NPC111]
MGTPRGGDAGIPLWWGLPALGHFVTEHKAWVSDRLRRCSSLSHFLVPLAEYRKLQSF